MFLKFSSLIDYRFAVLFVSITTQGEYKKDRNTLMVHSGICAYISPIY